jgi:hypothetical protein
MTALTFATEPTDATPQPIARSESATAGVRPAVSKRSVSGNA